MKSRWVKHEMSPVRKTLPGTRMQKTDTCLWHTSMFIPQHYATPMLLLSSITLPLGGSPGTPTTEGRVKIKETKDNRLQVTLCLTCQLLFNKLSFICVYSNAIQFCEDKMSLLFCSAPTTVKMKGLTGEQILLVGWSIIAGLHWEIEFRTYVVSSLCEWCNH